MRSTLPSIGLSRDEIFAHMKALSAGDVDWRRGRVPLYVFKANDEIAALGRDAFLEFFTENALGGKRAFHGLKKMEDDIVTMGLSLFHAPDDAAGRMLGTKGVSPTGFLSRLPMASSSTTG